MRIASDVVLSTEVGSCHGHFCGMRNQIILALNLALKKTNLAFNLALDPGFGIKLKWNDEQRK